LTLRILDPRRVQLHLFGLRYEGKILDNANLCGVFEFDLLGGKPARKRRQNKVGLNGYATGDKVLPTQNLFDIRNFRSPLDEGTWNATRQPVRRFGTLFA